jgi:hypothetical protein
MPAMLLLTACQLQAYLRGSHARSIAAHLQESFGSQSTKVDRGAVLLHLVPSNQLCCTLPADCVACCMRSFVWTMQNIHILKVG